jgi:16S rRNA (adenine1518-N6/adenine1519-N6)-dimethyltransferase
MSSEVSSGGNPREIVKQLGLKPLRSLGQNFMMDASVIEAIVRGAEIDPTQDVLVEVGPGTGALTSQLADSGVPLLCVELDRGLASYLDETFGPKGVRVIQGDVLEKKRSLNPLLLEQLHHWKSEGKRIKWISNLPYNILTPLLWNLLQVRDLWQKGIFLVQMEFAQRLRSVPGDDSYGPLGALSELYLTTKTLRKVSRRSFWPVPDVDSAVISVDPLEDVPSLEIGFQEFLKKGFSQRRKKLSKLISRPELPVAEIEGALEDMNYPGDARAESLVAQDLLLIYEKTSKRFN